MEKSIQLPLSKFSGFESPLSNVRFSTIEKDGKAFNSVEQYFQYYKAEFFGNKEVAKKIMESSNPMECTRIGAELDKVKAPAKWVDNAEKIMREACYAKFTQNEPIQRYLFKTTGSYLVFCHPEDYYWGIGLLKADPRSRNPRQWQGKNRLGEILMGVRDKLMKQPEYAVVAKAAVQQKEEAKRKMQGESSSGGEVSTSTPEEKKEEPKKRMRKTRTIP